MEKHQWAIHHRDRHIVGDTANDSADAAIAVVCKRIGRDTTYEDLVKLGFSLVRIRVIITIVGEEQTNVQPDETTD